MKKILLYAAMVLLSVTSCLKFEEPTSLEVQSAGAPTIEVSGLTENTFTATITPAAGTNFYAYAVLEGEVNPKVSASNLLKVKVGSDIAEGLVDVKNEATKTLALKGLVGNTKYTVYAAATNEQGQVASVTTLEVLTDDKTAPTIKDEAISKVGQILFTEPVKLVSGKKAWVTYYKYYDPADSVTMEIPAENMAVKGSVLQLTPPKHIPGAYTIYTYEKGLVTDYVGQECPAETTQSFKIHYDIMYEDSLVMEGVAGRIPTENWDLKWKDANKAGDTVIYFTNPSDLRLVFKTAGDIQKSSSVSGPKFQYNPMFDAMLYQKSAAYGIKDVDSTLIVVLNEPSNMFTNLDFTIPEGAYYDLYGNKNNAFEYETIASHIPCVSDGLEGVYVCYPYYGMSIASFTIEETSDTTATVYNLDPYMNSLEYPGVLKAEYDKKKGEILIPYGQSYYKDSDVDVKFFDYMPTRYNPEEDGYLIYEGGVEISVEDNGWLSSNSYYFLTELPEGKEAKDVSLKELYDNDLDWSSGWLYGGYGYKIIKLSNDIPSISSAAQTAKSNRNYVEKRKFDTYEEFLNSLLKK